MDQESKMNQEIKPIAFKQSAKYQYLAAIVVNLLTVGCGCTGGWPSPNILILESDATPLATGKITMEECSWIASLWCIGGLIGNPIFCFITNNYGRKMPLVFLAIPAIISWLLILYAQNVYYLYAGRLMCGIVASGVFIIVPLFLSEIANDRLRGALGSTMVLTANFGVLVAYTLGNYCEYSTTPKFVIAAAILFAILLLLFPEPPIILIKQNKLREAEQSICFYQNIKRRGKHHDQLQFEVNKLRDSLCKVDKPNVRSFEWSDLARNPGQKAFLIGILLAVLNQFCGCIAMMNYTANIFKESGSTLPPNSSAIIVGIIQLVGSFVATNLVDRAGRKILYIASTFGSAVGLISLGVYMMLKSWGVDVEPFNWIPVVSFSFLVFIAAWAILSLPFVVVSETMPELLKDFGASFCLTLVWICGFIVTKYLPLSIQLLGFGETMFLFAAVCLISAILIIFFLPETKGKSYEEIMNLLH